MATIVEVRVAAEEFRIGRILDGVDAVQLELERMIPMKERLMPFLWVHDADYEAVERAIRADEATTGVEIVTELVDRALFHIEWTADLDGFVETLTDYGATVLTAVGTADHWDFQLRFEDEAAVPRFRRACRDAGVRLDFRRIYNAADPALGDPTGLTPAQREALLTALEEGYFSIPRDINLVELAEELGVSDQAVSERLRRAQIKLLTAGVIAGPDAIAEADRAPDPSAEE